MRRYRAADSPAGEQDAVHSSIMDMNAVPSGDPGGVSVAPGQERMAGGQAGVVGAAGPVVADADQGKAVGYQAGVGGGIGDEGSVGAVVGVQVRDGRAVLRSGG